ncbi:histidine phosphatase superfamily [Lipomyces oligophaga]|uniref:histidine phosphatase superfamily n=1 Tax=Lipomyces oligophaga TaxID=45792 RepID=UPI0034CD0FC4
MIAAKLSILALVASTSASAYTFDNITHYAPSNTSFNNLNAVFSSSSGTNGGFYNTSTVPAKSYGAYNYCNMPHVRASEYVKPSNATLQYVEILHRHHKRTPYASNTFPTEDIAMYCDNEKIFYFGEQANGINVSQVYWKNYQDSANPMMYYQAGFNGTCQFPQISFAGLSDSAQHGQDIYSVYGDLLKFLPSKFDPTLMRFRATSNVITSQVAGALILAMYPDTEEVPVWQQTADQDSMEPGYSCSWADDVRTAYQSTDAWYKHLNMSQSLYDKLDAISGVDPTDSGWHSWFDHYFDNLSSRTCHQLPLPCNVTNSTDCITQDMAEQVFRLGDYEYNYIFRQADNSTVYSATHYGAFLAEVVSRLKGRMAGTEPTIYRHNVGHDGSVSPLMGALQATYLRWPGMGAEVVFELWTKNDTSGYYIRVLYGGQPLATNTPMGTLDMIPVDTFISYIESLVGANGSNVVKYCQA